MKKVLLFCALALGVSIAQAQLLFDENFNGFTAGNLGTQGGWVTEGATTTPDFQVITNPGSNALTKTGYESGGNYLNAANVAGRDVRENFISNQTITASANSQNTFYISFVVRVPSATTTASTNSALPSMALRTSDGDDLGYFYIGDVGTSTNSLRFGISKTEGGGGDGEFSGTAFNFNETYLIVIRYNLDVTNPPGGSVDEDDNDDMYLWVNPSTSTEPAIGSALVTIDDDTNDGDDGNYETGDVVNSFELFQSNTSSSVFSATASFDGLRIAAGATATQAWTFLSAEGIPLPVRFTSFSATEKNNAIQLNWVNATEKDVVNYTIERSSNGGEFTAIATVAPTSNNDSKVAYQYLDEAPLSGSNFYRIKAVETTGKISYTIITKLTPKTGGAASFTIFPNPVTTGNAAVQFTNLQKGKYQIQVVSNSGQVVSRLDLNHQGGSFSQSVGVASLKAGVYHMLLNGPVKMQKQFIVK